MLNQFIEFRNFIYEATGRHPEFANSFQNIYIYIPNDKKPPAVKNSSSRRTVSIQNYFANRSKDFHQLVYNDHWNSLEDHLGSDLLRFCLRECIFAKRTKTGGFMVSNLANLRIKITHDRPQRLNKIFYKTATCCEEFFNVAENPNGGRKSPEVSNSDKLLKWEEHRKNLNYLFHLTDMEISTDDLLFKISRSRKFPDSHILVKKIPRTNLSSQVVNTRVGNCKITEYEDCVEPLELMLRKLKKLHNKYNYERHLSQLIAPNAKHLEKGTGKDKISGNPLPINVLKMYFTNICSSVIPRELFGSHKNRNTVVKIICDLLETPKHQSISLKPYILKMRISDMRWLDGVKNTDAQWSMLAKLLKWIFQKYILQIFRTQLYIISTNSTKKIYFTQRDWQKLTTQFLHKMCKDKVIARTNGLETKVSCDGRWLLFPKKNGVRPIMSRIRGSRQDEATKIALCYLQQLYVTKYPESGNQTYFLEKWRDLVNKFRNGRNKSMYLVCCDIQYAFGSIDQKKLVKIVESLADSTGPEMSFKYYKIARNLEAVKSDAFKSKLCVTYPELELPVASKSVFASGPDKIAKVSKEILLREIKQNISNQNILISNQRYLLQKGIPQGATLSSVLCDLYYAHMEESHLSQFKNEGFLHRYVDDILFATEDEALAERFLQCVKNGFPEYNCSFNAAKTRTNLPGHELTVKPITYLGFNIDPETLEVTTDYSKSPRYTMTLSKPRYKITETFRKRLSNLASLKLDGVVLDCVINSEETVLKNIKSIFTRQAERCLWLLKALFDDIPSQLCKIFRIIQSTNLKIIRRVQRYFLANGYDFEKLVPRLAVIPWKCYRQIFGKAPNVHVHFRSLLLESLKMNEFAVAGTSRSTGRIKEDNH